MNEKLLLEYVDRAGIVTLEELAARAGSAGGSLLRPVLSLIGQKHVFFCRLDHGAETLISIHMLFCLMSVYAEPELTAEAQELLDWLSDHGPATEDEVRAALPGAETGFEDAFAELQRKLCVAPAGTPGEPDIDEAPAGVEITAGSRFKWVTTEAWLDGMHRAGRYRELEYCISEIRRLMQGRFTTRELNSLIYRGEL